MSAVPRLDEQALLAHCLELPGAWPDEPWGDGVVCKVGPGRGKVFAVPRDDALVVKGDPDDLLELREAWPDDVGDAPYLSHRHWVRVRVGGAVPDEELRELVERSWALVVAGLPRAAREAVARRS